MRHVLKFRPDTTVSRQDGAMVLEVPWRRRVVRLADLFPVLDALRHGSTVEDLEALSSDLPTLYYLLETLGRSGFLCHSVGDLVTVVPMRPDFVFRPGPVSGAFRLSRFAYMRRLEEDLVLESPRSVARAVLGPRMAALLAGPVDVASVAEDEARAVAFLVAAGLLDPVEEGRLAEDADPVLRMWDFHDLLFHARSRQGRHDYPCGALQPFVGELEPLPAVKPPMSQDVVELPRADIPGLRAGDVPFTEVLEARKSVRARGDEPLTVQQLGEFLYRCARVRTTWPASPEQGILYEAAARPYPSGGGSWDLEIYVTVNACRGLESGLYHYDPLGHRLERLSGRTPHVERALDAASRACLGQVVPDVLLSLTSRFGRLGWRYRAWAYSATLRNAGVLLQTMYLVATAMGLSPCAVASGDAQEFAEATGVDYFAESTVSEFMLSGPPAAPYSVRWDAGEPVNV